jgi:hypothetical protein
MPFSPGQVISYMAMCTEEQSSLQRGMNFRLGPSHSVILMSVRVGAPYEDQVSDDGQTLIYEGHNAPRSTEAPVPQIVDQPLATDRGTPTQNGRFYAAAEACRNEEEEPERVHVYEKIRTGIWVYSGLFLLIDAWSEQSGSRSVFKFKLELSPDQHEGPNIDGQKPTQSPGRMIPTVIKLKVWERDGGRCTRCGANDDLHYDHIIPFSKGGSSLTEQNIQLLCAHHNLEKSAQIM